jgi:disulfide bond formation protein DsbB
MKKYIVYLPYIAWFQAIAATLGSLFFSEIMHLPPCVLCWYQRIFMYPLTILLGVGIWKKDKNIADYALPLSIGGLLVALYHNLLYYGIIPESQAPCSAGVSCTTKFFAWFGFITIPFLSFLAFSTISVMLYIFSRKSKEK